MPHRTASHLIGHLPSLRRYARSLTGLTERGDDLLVRLIETAMMAPDRFGIANESRVPLYALLNLLFDADRRMGVQPVPSPYPVERALAGLEEEERRIYLLSVLENLVPRDVAAVLEVSPERVAAALARARERLRRALMQRVLVVEDNPLLAMELEGVVSSLGHEVCGTVATTGGALAMAAQHPPTMALLDVRLGEGGDGIDLARELRRRGVLRTIFITAFDQELERRNARHLGPVIAKPYSTEAIRGAISRAVFMPSPVAVA
jgi:CheY-like chemotaxis protein